LIVVAVEMSSAADFRLSNEHHHWSTVPLSSRHCDHLLREQLSACHIQMDRQYPQCRDRIADIHTAARTVRPYVRGHIL